MIMRIGNVSYDPNGDINARTTVYDADSSKRKKGKNVFVKGSILLVWTVLLRPVTVALLWLKVV